MPRVLLIGDSISRGYTVPTRHVLAGKVNVHRAPENCGPTATAMQKLDLWLGDRNWDVIHFNFGIHDRNTPASDYLIRLEHILGRLASTGASLIWATTTPIGAGAELYEQGSSERSNGLATPLMARHGVRINDLHALTLPKLGEIQIPKDCHFHEAGYELMGRQVADAIVAALRDRGR
ncbi:MAG: G-D-S-L family lipolytic protein [Lentisphaerae bacterium RIFOXYB12_FULL_65_16]|nr:MAG: G-D-S-L family lipolytic protein [Lentisphaerae bacterium RIFOXYA12_64_32]OGV86612.1 MAG: G-D-S-L family lipolytic protein [Lentisphaerae bacterium RIFOXYB12_FULL_65_16]